MTAANHENDGAITLQIWVGNDLDLEGHEQVLTVDQLKQLAPLIGEKAVEGLLARCKQWGLQ